jgi:2-polyprenyl-3-methyl-5-hydroxy-6-metoxy-1,4-benzoquinol methylase
MSALIRRIREGFAFRLQSRFQNPLAGLLRVALWLRRALSVHWIYTVNKAAVEFRHHWVSPGAIEFASHRREHWWHMGGSPGGNWDELSFPFEHFDFYQSFVAVKRNSRTWNETPFYQRVLGDIRAGRDKLGCRSQDQLDRRLEHFRELYRDMEEFGFIPKHSDDQVRVDIGRDGDLLFCDGPHWLTFAKLHKLDRVAIAIGMRHRLWTRFKREIVRYAMGNRGQVYEPIPHPDLESIRAQHGHKRFELIRRNLVSDGGRMLDIGCHWGYFCHQFERLGYRAIGVEASSRNFYFLKKIKRATSGSFQIENCSICDFLEGEDCRYEVVLALAVLHDFVKTATGLEQLKNLLRALNAREMFFMPHSPHEPQMSRAHWNPGESEFLSFVLDNSSFSDAVLIGHEDDGRPLYRLT